MGNLKPNPQNLDPVSRGTKSFIRMLLGNAKKIKLLFDEINLT
jgi:hypothetical protein